MECVKVNFHLTWKFITRVLFSFTITVREVCMFNAQCIERDIACLINTVYRERDIACLIDTMYRERHCMSDRHSV